MRPRPGWYVWAVRSTHRVSCHRALIIGASAALSRVFVASTRATVGQVSEIQRGIEELEAELADHFEQHPDAAIYRSMPGLGIVLGARVLGEFGGDLERYESAKSRRNYAGTSPLTVASGRKRTVRARFVRNRRLSDAVGQWALCSPAASTACRDFYDRRRAAGDLHRKAQRAPRRRGQEAVTGRHTALSGQCARLRGGRAAPAGA